MFKTIQRLYEKTNNKEIVANAVMRGYISAEDYERIVGEVYEG